MKWISTKEKSPEKDGLYLIVHNAPGSYGRHEMYFKTEDKKWYWQPNPYSVCGDGFITEWLDESESPTPPKVSQSVVEMAEKWLSEVPHFIPNTIDELLKYEKQAFIAGATSSTPDISFIGKGINDVMSAAYISGVSEAMRIVGQNLIPNHNVVTPIITNILERLNEIKTANKMVVESSPTPESIVEKLREANPYSAGDDQDSFPEGKIFDDIWVECCDKLKELLTRKQ